jgi:hypothetical protein
MVWAAALALTFQQGEKPVVVIPPAQPIPRAWTPTIAKQVDAPTPPDNKETMSWRKVGRWHIRIDHSLSNGCFAAMMYSDRTIFRIGINNDAGGVYFLLASPYWKSLDDRKTVAAKVTLYPGTVWTATANTGRMGADRSLAMSVTDKALLDELLQAKTFFLSADGQAIGSYDISGFDQALIELNRCQKSVDEALDPFAR